MIFEFDSVVRNEEETSKIAKDFASHLTDGDVVVLTGKLGAGKTFFVRACCEVWNIGNVSSPTFAIVNEYTGDKKVYHFDFYRVETSEELYDLGIDDYLERSDGIIFIEWGETHSNTLPEKRYNVSFTILEEDKRKISIEYNEG